VLQSPAIVDAAPVSSRPRFWYLKKSESRLTHRLTFPDRQSPEIHPKSPGISTCDILPHRLGSAREDDYRNTGRSWDSDAPKQTLAPDETVETLLESDIEYLRNLTRERTVRVRNDPKKRAGVLIELDG